MINSEDIDRHAHKFDKDGVCPICYMNREELFIQASGELPDQEYITSEGDNDG